MATALVTAVPALLNLAPVVSASAASKDVSFPAPTPTKRVTLGKEKPHQAVKPRKPYARFDPSGHAALPVAQNATVTLSAKPAAGLAAARVRAGSSPVSLAPTGKGDAPRQVRVTTVDQKSAQALGVHGMMFTLQSTSGTGGVAVSVDDATFRITFGGDFASRLRLVQLPACALETPHAQQCQTQTPVRTEPGKPLSARVALPAAAGPTVLAATSGTSGSSGDYSATSLSPGGTWAAGDNSGSFTYNYPITVPPAIGGDAPTVGLSYNSVSQDARTLGTNSQSSWLGDGWSTSDSFIERTYQPCDDVKDSGAPKGSADLCWAGQILTLSLNGSSTRIVYDDTRKTFHPLNDSATTKVERLSGTTNGTKNDEYFRVTKNGVQYYFGLNRLPGWASGADETRSAWTVPVYKAHADVADCPGGAFADTACTLGYRFNLDYVVDTDDNAMAYYYAAETGYYGANMKKTAVSYIRGGTLKRIDYGLRPSTIYSSPAPQQIEFATDERCFPGEPAGNSCAADEFKVSHPEYWPDVPIDLNCTKDEDCAVHGASFWSRRRLTTITTKVRSGGVTAPVDRYDFAQSFPDNGDTAPTLWLDSIRHVGQNRLGGATGDAGTPAVTFHPVQLRNRVGTLPGLPKMYHNRIGTVVSETGAETVVAYDTPDCSDVPASDLSDDKDAKAQEFASTNTTGCFPVYWTPEAQPRPMIDWFYTHPVRSVTTYDNHNHYQDGSAPLLLTEYSYKGKPGWHYDDNEIVKAKNRTWGQFRGYPEVDVTSGDPTAFHYTDGVETHDRKTLTKTYYFLGMDDDTLPGGKTRSAPALSSQDRTVSVPDNDVFAGQVFETDTYTGLGGTIDQAVVTVPMVIGPTASRSRDGGLQPLRASMVRTAKTLTRQKVSYGWRNTSAETFYNTTLGQSTTGMAVQSVDRGEPGAAGNTTTCTFTRYLDSSTATLVLEAEEILTDQDCNSPRATPSGTLISDTRTSYDDKPFAYNGDGQSAPARPAKANPTLTQQASAATGATATTFVDTAATTYDMYGRATSTTRTPKSKAADQITSLSQTTYTRYTPAEGALPTSTVTVAQVTPGFACSAVTKSSKDCQLSTATLDPARQLPVAAIDIAGAQRSLRYDALGRLTDVWLENKSRAAGALPNMTYTYALSQTGPSVVTTRTLLDNDAANAPAAYRVSKVLYDAMLRALETQATGENDSVVASDTQYDTHGWTVLTNNSYAVAGAPRDQLLSDRLSQVSIPSTTVTDHDAMGRATQVTQEHNAVETTRTRTAYTGDKTTVVPPAGRVATTTTTDARGQVTQLQQYTGAPTLAGTSTDGFTATGGTSHKITYGYTSAGEPATITGPDNAVWSYAYDLLGRQTSHVDPDTGTSYAGYDDAGNLTTTKDGRGVQLNYTYDLLGRKLTATDRGLGDFKIASWTYDTLRIGKPTSSSRFVSGVTGGYTVAVTGYSTLGNPLGQTITLPSVERPLPPTYTTKFKYTPNTELLAQQDDPAVGSMPGESITYSHNLLGAPTKTTGAEQYVSGSLYTDFGQPSRITMGDSTNDAQVLYSYDEQTLRLSGRAVHRTQAPGPLVDDIGYTYDDAGNPLSVTNKQAETGNVVTDTQCYRYDGLARLANAWTANTSCSSGDTPASGTLSNKPGAYWQSFIYNAVGDRTQLVEHSTSGGTDSTTTYTNGCTVGCNPTGPQPHTLTATTGGPDPTKFVYDVAGNLISRTPAAAGKGQNLKWDHEGRLAEVATTGSNPTVTKYLYDADGNQLIRRDPGRTTLFAGDTQVVIDTSVAPAVLLGAVRTYAHGGGPTVAVRSTLPGGGTSYLLNDPHGTAGLSMDTTTQRVSRQQNKPYGEPRASANPTLWPDPTHGYLGAPKDPDTGYTDLGARKYDPALGRFISADPILQISDVNRIGGYTYAGDNPITLSDPSGLDPCIHGGGGCHYDGTDPDGALEVPETNSRTPCTNANACERRRKSKDDGRKLNTKLRWGPQNKQCQASPGACKIARQNLESGTSPAEVDASMKCGYYSGGFNFGLGACMAREGYYQGWTDPDVAQVMVGAGIVGKFGGVGKTSVKTALRTSCHSFDPDTLVLLADGKSKAIKDVRVGDEVIATDPETAVTGPEKVTATHTNDDKSLSDVTVVVDGGQKVVVRSTADHPFYSQDRRDWVYAAELQPGERLRVLDGAAVVETVKTRAGSKIMRDLTVANTHTYYVIAGKAPVLVHNCGFELQDLGASWYQSPNGLLYGPGSAQGHRITHVLEHGSADVAGKATHSVFDTGRRGILETVDEAWLQRGTAANIRAEGNRTVYESIPMGRQVGFDGQRSITVVVRNGDEMITAFPQ